MSGREETLRRLAEDNPERFFCWSENIDIGATPRYTGVASVRCRLAVLPGFDGTDHQVFEGEDFIVCVSLVREAIRQADREAYERDMAEGNDRPASMEYQQEDCDIEEWLPPSSRP